MTKTQAKKEPLKSKEEAPKSKTKINDKGEIAAPLNLSKIKADEIFSYLGDKYIVQLHTRYKTDKDGNQIPKEFVTPAGRIIDGYVKDTPEAKLYSVESVPTSAKKTVSDFGKPLNVRVTYNGPIDAEEVFTVEGKPLVYDNVKLRETESLVLRNREFVKASLK